MSLEQVSASIARIEEKTSPTTGPAEVIDLVREQRNGLRDTTKLRPSERIYIASRLIERLHERFGPDQPDARLGQALVAVMDDTFPAAAEHASVPLREQLDQALGELFSRALATPGGATRRRLDLLLRLARLRGGLFIGECGEGHALISARLAALTDALDNRDGADYGPFDTPGPQLWGLLSWLASCVLLEEESGGVSFDRLVASLAKQLGNADRTEQLPLLLRHWAGRSPFWSALLCERLSMEVIASLPPLPLSMPDGVEREDDTSALWVGDQRSGKSSLIFALDHLHCATLGLHPADHGYGSSTDDPGIVQKRQIWRQQAGPGPSDEQVWKTERYELYAESPASSSALRICFFDTPGELFRAQGAQHLEIALDQLVKMARPRLLVIVVDSSKPLADPLGRVLTTIQKSLPQSSMSSLDQIWLVLNKADIAGGHERADAVVDALVSLPPLNLAHDERSMQRWSELAANPVVGDIALTQWKTLKALFAAFPIAAKVNVKYSMAKYSDAGWEQGAGRALKSWWMQEVVDKYATATVPARKKAFDQVFEHHWTLCQDRGGKIAEARSALRKALTVPELGGASLKANIGRNLHRVHHGQLPDYSDVEAARDTALKKVDVVLQSAAGLAKLLRDAMGAAEAGEKAGLPPRSRLYFSHTNAAGLLENVDAERWWRSNPGKCHRTAGVVHSFVPGCDNPSLTGSFRNAFTSKDHMGQGGMWRFLGYPPGSGDLRNWYVTKNLLEQRFPSEDAATVGDQLWDPKTGVVPYWASLLETLEKLPGMQWRNEMVTIGKMISGSIFKAGCRHLGLQAATVANLSQATAAKRGTLLDLWEHTTLVHFGVGDKDQRKQWNVVEDLLKFWMARDAQCEEPVDLVEKIDALIQSMAALVEQLDANANPEAVWLDAVLEQRKAAFMDRYGNRSQYSANADELDDVKKEEFRRLIHTG